MSTMSAEALEKPSRKHKKAKAQDAVASDGDAISEKVKKPKKSKRAHTDEAAADEAVEVAKVTDEVEESKKEKKHKKRKHAEETEMPAPIVDFEPKQKKKKHREAEHAMITSDAEAVAEPSTREKAAKKPGGKERKGKGEEDLSAAGEMEVDEGGIVDPAAQPESRTPKMQKRKDKQKRKKDARDNDGAAKDAQSKHDVAAKKKAAKKPKRRPRNTDLPDPTDDETLSGQAQKALLYAYTQFEEPDEWKFNKARQNWLIRNVWSDEAIPDKYLPTATKYLEGVQGGAREALIKSCQEALEPAQSTTEATAAESKPEDSESHDMPAQRTVKFAAPEVQHGKDAPSTSSKSQRATTLLALLTSNGSSKS
ncbi:hypothetical protein BC628DRAFT_389840 [Trametes gibbosa]|nr:hypothetical protein BC628DRAFT_389840 [Trametes gibbosa]